MSAAPEEFLAQGAYLAAPEPFSPSIFLDLPPTPRPNGDDPTSDDPASSDDLVLPFISRMLMEEDIDNKFFYQFPDHSAPQRAVAVRTDPLRCHRCLLIRLRRCHQLKDRRQLYPFLVLLRPRICRPHLALRPNRALPAAAAR